MCRRERRGGRSGRAGPSGRAGRVGEGAEETHLRDAAESHGGIFIAQQNLDDPVEELDAVKMLKFFETAYSTIFEEEPVLDPHFTTWGVSPGVVSEFPLTFCGSERSLSVVVGRQKMGQRGANGGDACDLRLEVESPAGKVERSCGALSLMNKLAFRPSNQR